MKNKNLFLLILLATCWGPSFLFIKVAVAEVSPMMLTAIRIGVGAIVLNGFLLLKGDKLPKDLSFWRKVLVAGFFGQALPFALINWGEQFVDSSLAAVLNGLTPISTILLAQMMLPDEKMTKNKLKGALMGFAGLIILVFPSLLGGVASTTMGIVAITAASISYGLCLVYVRKNLLHAKPNHAPAAQLLTVTIYLIPLAFLLDPEFSLLTISWGAQISMLILGIFGTAVAFVIYFKLLERTSAAYVSMVTFLMPIYGIVLGILFLNEAFNLWMLAGSVCILGGIFLVSKRKERIPKRFDERVDFKVFSPFK